MHGKWKFRQGQCVGQQVILTYTPNSGCQTCFSFSLGSQKRRATTKTTDIQTNLCTILQDQSSGDYYV